MKCSIIKCLIVSIILVSCGLPRSSVNYSKTEKIITGPGPEDFVLDTITNPTKPRIIVSCNERRSNDISKNGFYSVDINSNKCTQLILKNMPASQLEMRPHGIDIVLENDGILRLYAINHNDKVNKQYVVKFKVFENYLEFEAEYYTPLITSPNDVSGKQDGSFFTTNDSRKRGSLIEPLLKLKWGSVIHSEQNGTANYKFSKRYCYANGVFVSDNGIYVSTTRQNKLFFVDYKTNKKKMVGRGKGLDNITLANNSLIVTAHLKQIKFIKHAQDSNKISPTVVYAYDLSTKKRTCLYSNSGKEISAASTAILYKNKLYISQVFDGFILVKGN